MKNFVRSNQYLSLCGLNCKLCSMYLGGHCGGCGNGNQSCTIAKCSMQQNKVEYCFECKNYPCTKYKGIDQYDSFITHKNQMKDLDKAKIIGMTAYNHEQLEKMEYLSVLLEKYNNGRRKTFYCVAVNLLDLDDLSELFQLISSNKEFNDLSMDNQCDFVYHLFKTKEKEKNIEFKLRKKQKV